MRDEFNMTPVPVTTGPGKMALSRAIDTSNHDVVVAVLSVLTGSGSGSPNFTVRLIGSMSKDSEDGWVELVAFTALGVFTPTTLVVRGDKLLKYLRWEVVQNGGTVTSVTFTVSGFLSTSD